MRIDVKNFQFSKSQKRVLNKNKDTKVFIRPPTVTKEHMDLYHKYHTIMQDKKDWKYVHIDHEDYIKSYVEGNTKYATEFLYLRDDELIGVALVDILPNAISSIYCFYDHDFEEFSIGKFSILTQINIAKELNITGPFNIQFLVKDNIPYVIEVNLRASRTFPLLSKAMNVNFPELAVDSFFGRALPHNFVYPKSVVVKSSQFSFSRLLGADPVLRVEMSSTGEVACFGSDYDEALLKSILSANKFDFSKKAVLFSIGGQVSKAKFLEAARAIRSLGYTIFATNRTASFFKNNGIVCQVARKAHEKVPTVIDIIEGKKVSFVVNLSEAKESRDGIKEKNLTTDGYKIRRATVDNQIPLFTDMHLARAFIKALSRYDIKDLQIKSYNEYIN